MTLRPSGISARSHAPSAAAAADQADAQQAAAQQRHRDRLRHGGGRRDRQRAAQHGIGVVVVARHGEAVCLARGEIERDLATVVEPVRQG